MPASEASVVIPQPVSVVWDYCCNAENLSVYLPGALETRAVTEGPLQVGTRWTGRTRFLGPTMVWTGEFSQIDLNKFAVFTAVESPFDFTATTSFSETDDGTRFTYRMDTEAGLGGLFGKLTDPIVVRAYTRALRAGLENLVDVLGDGG